MNEWIGTSTIEGLQNTLFQNKQRPKMSLGTQQWHSQGLLYGRARRVVANCAGAHLEVQVALRGRGGMLPQENLNFRPSETAFGAF